MYHDAFETALEVDREAGSVRLSEASSRLRGQLDVYRVLANVAADEPIMALAAVDPEKFDVSNDLAKLNLKYGAHEIELTDPDGNVIASSSSGQESNDYPPGLIRAAINGRLGYSVELDGDDRLVRFSRGINIGGEQPLGVIVVSTNLAALEFEWPVIPEPVIFFDSEGLSISSNRPNLLLFSNSGDPELAKFPLNNGQELAGSNLWSFTPSRASAEEVQSLTTDIPQLQMTGQILLDTASARDTALLRLGLAAALLFALALVGAIILQQRRRLALEFHHSSTLEQRVEERTAELRSAQVKLVEASNLAALGRLSAGISHELNQPLAAILNFDENGKNLIKKSRVAEADENLAEISNQVRRINRIIGNLRAFSKQEKTPLARIDLVEAANQALELASPDISSANVKLQKNFPDRPVFVMAGKVRLEQVILNLISNAIDAMLSSETRMLSLSIEIQQDNALLTARDTGTGIEEPERVFEPFYTTKELGSSKGMGMGLALAFGIVSNFGGTLDCRNTRQGAEFSLILPLDGRPS
ncbi:MAG: ATP-binding protein [Pseudomonadota bacterium]